MTVEIKYKDLIDRCEQLSSFESEGKVDAAGQSRYLEIHINEVDKLLVQQYIEQAKRALEERMDRMIVETTHIEVVDACTFEGIKNYLTIGEVYNNGELGSYPIVFVKDYWNSVGGDTLNKFVHAKESSDSWTIGYPIPNEYEWSKHPDSVFYDGVSYYRWNKDGTDIVDFIPDLSSQGFSWTLRTDTRWKENASFSKHVSEAIVAYAMSAWLSDKLPERVAFYDALFTASTEMAVKNIFKKQVPRYEE